MEAEAQISHDLNTQLQPEAVFSVQNGDLGVSSSVANAVIPQQPAPKKPTRQWAAWTRQEEESFFTALRQVGKNFEKITCRVQSKNKDQVRHYYYRLVRRMNKLLGPGLCLDAKNSKDTNAAMLRWWSLLEKYSCKASKLHLKPRRFKIFLEALEHQLMKDRKKNVRKRPLQGGNCLPAAPTTVSNQSRASGNDARAVKLVLVDSQNMLKLGPSKPSMKRNVNMGVSRSNAKGDSSTMKPTRQRKKSGMVSAAAYRKWEKAAIAGVSLVADAAEHLERAATVQEIEHDQENPGEKCSDPVDYVLPPLPTYPQNHFVDNNLNNCMKLKLQLFPIDEPTRRALEMDKHNPYLELTLSTRKKISSVVEHLNRKWGNSSIAVGELMLFPYGIQRENLVNYQRWRQESTLSAADIYAMIGSPPTFRLRYGWFSNTEPGLVNMQVPVASSCMLTQSKISVDNTTDQIVNSASLPTPSTSNHTMELSENCRTSVNRNSTLTTTSTDMPNTRDGVVYLNTNTEESCNPTANTSWHGKDVRDGDGAVTTQLEDMDRLKLGSGTGMSAGEWADSLTNISVGDLLSGVSQDLEDNCIDPPIAENCHGVQQIPFSSDSFDAAIAAHISRHQDKMEQPCLASHVSSIWDAEETCDAFLFKKDPILRTDGPSPIALESEIKVPERSFGKLDKLSPEKERLVDDFGQADPMPVDSCESDADIQDHLAKDYSALTDMYWPDSLGPLDLDIPSTKYHSEDLIFSDSLSGLNRLIASSLDAFQNCSFFGFDKKETPTVEARETATLSDFKIGSGI
ncbi:TSL-kinase interacting protein 1 isoform X2 [Abrus precatorius]|uniref:TSL-kinase interacting protein 1 isoform X2 n=1 Tax=Abrus precatorius TaxID=3816 RepID=A0A8B8KMX3_ABRPR|nr:TSL-kinase interacting protein 1 isoform X2 [Abrus precatorius]